MPMMASITLKCDECGETCIVLAPLTGKQRYKLRVNMSVAELPEGWWAGIADMSDGYHPSELEPRCGCPKHAEQERRRES